MAVATFAIFLSPPKITTDVTTDNRMPMVNFQLNELAKTDYTWKIIDQRGIEVIAGNLKFDSLGVFSVDVNELKNGVYYVIIQSNDKPLIYRKLAIMNRR